MKKTDQKCETPISSLIDIVFLLIMFFVATANFDSQGFDDSVDLAKAKNLQKLTKKPASQIPITIKYNALSKKGYDIKISGISVDTQEDIKRRCSSMVQRFGDLTEAYIRCDNRCKLGALEDVTAGCSAAGVKTLKISAEVEGKN